MSEQEQTPQSTSEREAHVIDRLRLGVHMLYMEMRTTPTQQRYNDLKTASYELWRALKPTTPEPKKTEIETEFSDLPSKYSPDALNKASAFFDKLYELMTELGYGTLPSPLSKAKLDDKYDGIELL